jgi:hypothetical protein
MERTCVPSRLSIRLTIDSESFRELTGTNDLPSSLQKKLDQITAHHLYTGFPLHLEVSETNHPRRAQREQSLLESSRVRFRKRKF